ncbi:MAG: sensor histidine kinase, partial [Clostridia bacterium]|nr:sensor histidine kinase [Clostridia bacterium]
MYLRLAAITVLLTGTNVLMLVALQSLQPWVVAIYMLALNFLVLTILAESNWLPQKTYLPSADTAATTTLQIAHETLPYLRRGLNQATAEKVCEVILKIGDVAAAAITDKETVLAFLGVGCEKHQPGDRILTEATKQVLATGQYKIVRTTTELRCSVK